MAPHREVEPRQRLGHPHTQNLGNLLVAQQGEVFRDVLVIGAVLEETDAGLPPAGLALGGRESPGVEDSPGESSLRSMSLSSSSCFSSRAW